MNSLSAQNHDQAISPGSLVGSSNVPFSSTGERGADDGSRRPFPRRPYTRRLPASDINRMLRLVVGGTFIAAGVLKIADPANFAVAVGNYRLLPNALINLVAITVPWIEVAAGALVLAGIWLRAAALVITAMTTMFAIVILSALARGLNIECGCFGTIGGQHVGLVNLAIDGTLLGLASLLAWRSKGTVAA